MKGNNKKGRKERKDKTQKNFSEIYLGSINSKVKQAAKTLNYDHVIKTTIIEADDIIKGIKTPSKSIIIHNINKSNVNKLINRSSYLKKFDIVMVQGTTDYNINKKILEKMGVDVFFPYVVGKDFMHWRNSGLNNVLVDIMAKKSIALGLDFSFFRQNDDNDVIKMLGRIIQNVRFCNKRDCDFCVTFLPSNSDDFKNVLDVRSLLSVLGVKTQKLNSTLSFFHDRAEYNKKARKKKIAEGIWMK